MTPMRRLRMLTPGAAAAISLLALGGVAQAHGKGKAEHGGLLQLVGETSVELVNAPDHVEVWVEDSGDEVPSSGLTGKLILDASAHTEIALAPAGDNKLEAKGATLPKGAEVTVLIVSNASQAKTAATFKIN